MPTLNWIGKEAVVNHHHQVPFRLLKDVPELACGEPGTGNLIVEGDNLEALKALLSVSDTRALNFKTSSYEPSWVYEGGHQFKKHYFGPKPGELREKKADGKLTEEFQCACYLDALPAVRWWVRNLSNKSTSFRLQTSKQWFYPDFICQLTDGRIMAVEYKGKHLWDDAEEKRAVGAVWESRSKGRCLFVMPTDGKFTAIEEKCA